MNESPQEWILKRRHEDLGVTVRMCWDLGRFPELKSELPRTSVSGKQGIRIVGDSIRLREVLQPVTRCCDSRLR